MSITADELPEYTWIARSVLYNHFVIDLSILIVRRQALGAMVR